MIDRRRPLFLKTLAVVFVVVSLVYAGISWFVADRLTRPERYPLSSDPRDFGLDYESVEFESAEDRLTLRGWWIPSQDNDRAIILVHGRNSNRTGFNPQPGIPGGLLVQAVGIVERGYSVLSFDLRGHGLSEGEPDPLSAIDDLRGMLGEIRAIFGPVGLVCYGRIAHASFFIDERWGAPAQIAVSPVPAEDLNLDIDQSKPAMRMITYGSKDAESSTFVDDYYGRLRGQKLLVSTGADESGPELIRKRPQIMEQMTMFLRRYLPGHHLAFIADHADDIAARAEQTGAATETESG